MQGIGELLEQVAGDVRNTLEGAGYVTGFVPGQGAASAQFRMDVMSGDATPKDIGDWWEGVRTGKVELQ